MGSRKMSDKLMAFVLGVMVVLCASRAHATVYGWKGEGGVWHFSNDLDAVPEAQRASAKQFISKTTASAPVAPPEQGTPTTDSVTAVANPQIQAYERGLELGLQTAERQVALAGELARTVLAAAPRTPPTRIIIQQPGPTIVRYVTPDYYPSPYYGFVGPYAPPFGWGVSSRFPYAYSFRYGRLVPHSHFFPGVRGRQRGLFFPSGHFSHHGFLFGSGFVVR